MGFTGRPRIGADPPKLESSEPKPEPSEISLVLGGFNDPGCLELQLCPSLDSSFLGCVVGDSGLEFNLCSSLCD